MATIVEVEDLDTATAPTRRGPPAPLPPPDQLAKGQSLGRYVILQALGAGAMGMVYAAYDPQLDRKVAVKLLRQPGHVGDETDRRRLVREAQAMARLSHPNVITVHDVGTHGDDGEVVYVAMEFVDGQTLGQWLDDAPRSRAELLPVMLAAGQGLAAAHAKGLIHRDFKPDNVMLDDEGRVRVMDFGLARTGDEPIPWPRPTPVRMADSAVSELSSTITRAGAVVGTPAYMAPEQLRGLALDARADQYAFCVTLFEGLFGRRPFQATSLAELTAKVCGGEVELPPDSGVPAWLQRVVLRGLKVRPDERWPSMDDLLAALSRTPTRWARRAIGAAVVVTVSGAAYGGYQLDRASRARECEHAAAVIDQMWNDSTRERLTGAFERTGSPIATSMAERAAARLDDYTERWKDERTAVCLESEVEGIRSERSQAAVDTCLDAAAREAELLIEVFHEPDANVAHYAVHLTSELPPVGYCRERAERDQPGREEASEIRSSIRRALILSRLRRTAGDFEQAKAEAEQAKAEAERAGAPHLTLEAVDQLGASLWKLGHHDEAESLLRQAVFEAHALGRDDLVASVATTLVGMAPSRAGVSERDLWWAQLAEAALDRRGEGDTNARGELLIGLGNLYGVLGNFDEGLRAKERALKIFEAEFGDEHPSIAIARNNLGNTFLVRNQLPEAMRYYTEALEQTQALLGERHPSVADCMANVGNAHIMQGNADEALHRFEAALVLRREVLGTTHPKTSGSHYDLGSALFGAGKLDQAQEHFEQAVAGWRQTLPEHHPDLAMVYQGLAGVAYERKDLDEAQRHMERVIEIQNVNARYGEMLTSLTNLAQVQVSAEQLGAAKQTLARITAMKAEIQPKDRRWVDVHSTRALLAKAEGDTEGAQVHIRRAHTLMLDLVGPDHPRTKELARLLAGEPAETSPEPSASP